MTDPSAEQQGIINAPLGPLSVVACAGSGKTSTAVRRLVEMRRLLGDHRGRVALLSFSNVAVDTFRKSYQALAQNLPSGMGRDRVEIDTLDGFITSNVLRPHAYRTMKSTQAAFLVTGTETFLDGFNFNPGLFPLSVTKMQVGFRGDAPYFYHSNNNQISELNTAYALGIVNRLGKTGAYTHNLGRYWCHRALKEQPAILNALVRRYPHILIDESQDIGTLHQAILEQLMKAGAEISLIGDPNQGIYEFAGADGRFLTQYALRPGVTGHALTRNYRSVPPILTLANSLSVRADSGHREVPETYHGAFFIAYRNVEREQLIAAFLGAVLAAGLDADCSAVVCRGRELANKLSGIDEPIGQGVVKRLVTAAILRDVRQDYANAFKEVTAAIVALLATPVPGLVTRINQPARYPETRLLRREIWSFTRNLDTGLPSAALTADTQWHPLLLSRMKALLAVLHLKFSLVSAKNLGNKLAKRGLPNTPLVVPRDLAIAHGLGIRVDTVHQVKGESLDAVLYLATKEHAAALLEGVETEVGRIGYVAVTRARNLLWLAVPVNALAALRPTLLARGFLEAGVAIVDKA
jgi:superfamily I DNA/RNA helicase